MKEQIQILIDKFIPNERKKDFAKYARENGFEYRSRAGLARQDFGIRGFSILESNYWNELIGVLSKEEESHDMSTRVYDYLSTDNMGNHQTTIIEIRTDLLDISKFHIRPKSRIKRIKSLFVDPSNDFHDNYSIDSVHVGSIIEELGDDSLQFINSFGQISVEGDGGYIMVYMRYKKIKIYDLDRFYRFTLDLVDQILSVENHDDFV